MNDLAPYAIEVEEPGVVLIRFRSGRCSSRRMNKHEVEIAELVRSNETVKYDLSDTTAIGSAWIKWMVKMTLMARRMGKEVLCVGMSDSIRSMSEVIGVLDDLNFEQK
ncbi:MAG: hypothetical protein AVO35_12985 [Candidatus Aegiribacteria sp. MLS_C]|nr:MAG: hypothetical protein AVO35_12985 [Candidatus Aegiribacteria sp. MLS_C]